MSAFARTFKQGILEGSFDLANDALSVVLLDLGGYTFAASHQFLSSIPAQARVATQSLNVTSVASGVIDAQDAFFLSVPAGDVAEALWVYKDTGVEATSALVLYIDGLEIAPNGSHITLAWSDGVEKVARI